MYPMRAFLIARDVRSAATDTTTKTPEVQHTVFTSVRLDGRNILSPTITDWPGITATDRFIMYFFSAVPTILVFDARCVRATTLSPPPPLPPPLAAKTTTHRYCTRAAQRLRPFTFRDGKNRFFAAASAINAIFFSARGQTVGRSRSRKPSRLFGVRAAPRLFLKQTGKPDPRACSAMRIHCFLRISTVIIGASGRPAPPPPHPPRDRWRRVFRS